MNGLLLNELPGNLLVALAAEATLVTIAALIIAAPTRNPARRHAVLLAATLCLLVSPLLVTTVSLSGWQIDVPLFAAKPVAKSEEDALQRVDTGKIASPIISGEMDSAVNQTNRVSTLAKPHVIVISVDPPRASIQPARMDRILAVVWLLGTAVGLLAITRASWNARRLLRTARPLDFDRFADVLEQAARRLGLPRFPHVGVTAKLAVPSVAGIIGQPWVLLPPACIEQLTSAELLQVLVHEGAHVVRRDLWCVLLQRITGALFWWHPLMHLVHWELSRCREEICDNYVLRDVEPEVYGTTLLHLVRLLPPRPLSAAVLGMFGGRWKLEHRIAGLLNRRRSTATRVHALGLTSVLCGFAALSLMAAATRVVAEAPESVTQQPAEKSIDAQVEQAPARQQQQRVENTFGVELIHPSQRDGQLWRDLKKRLDSSAVKFRSVDIDENGVCRLNLSNTPTSDLSHLEGLPLQSLDLSETPVRDLSPLNGMPLRTLNIMGTQVDKLSPLKGMKLTQLQMSSLPVRDLSPLAEAELKQLVIIGGPLRDLTPLRNLPLELLWLSWFEGMDLSQLQGLAVKRLVLSGPQIADIAPLRGLKLESITLENTSVNDLSPLSAMPLRDAHFPRSPVTDLSPLKGLKLTGLSVTQAGVDLAPLAGMPLEMIALPDPATVKNLDVLRTMPTLKWIRPPECKPLPAAEFWQAFTAKDANAAAQPKAPDGSWRAFGRITDQNGQPMPGVEVWAHCGVGTLRRTGVAVSSDDGRYELNFGPGIAFHKDNPGAQAATITAHKDGFFEENLNRQGDCIAATIDLNDEALKAWGARKDKLFLPGRPLELNFVMRPSARVSGRLLDERGEPLAGYSVALNGAELPPSSSVLASATADEQGRFSLDDIPTTYRFQFDVRKSNPKPPWDDSWASAAVKFLPPEQDNLRAKFGEREIRVTDFVIRVAGPGVHGRTATAVAGNRGMLDLSAEPAAVIQQTEQLLTANSAVLVLRNESPTANKSLVAESVPAVPARASKTRLSRTRPNAAGEFKITFENPSGVDLVPDQNQIIFQVFVGASQKPILEKIFRQLDVLKEGRYEVPVKIAPEQIDDCRVSITFVTIQPNHDDWVKAFFHEGKGTSYSGLWIGDGGLMPAIPFDALDKK